jgi:hypothetical protein
MRQPTPPRPGRLFSSDTEYVKNGPPVARLAPDHEKVCTGRRLAEALARTQLPKDEAAVWRRDLQIARKTLKAPPDKWR